MRDTPTPANPPEDPHRLDALFDRVMRLLVDVQAMDERMKRVEKLTVEIALGLGINPNA